MHNTITVTITNTQINQIMVVVINNVSDTEDEINGADHSGIRCMKLRGG